MFSGRLGASAATDIVRRGRFAISDLVDQNSPLCTWVAREQVWINPGFNVS